MIKYLAKGKLAWRQNADIVVLRATGMDAHTAQTGFMSIATTRNIANGAARRVTGTDARMVRIGFTGMARVATSASGAARQPTARAAPTLRRADMRSDGPAAKAGIDRCPSYRLVMPGDLSHCGFLFGKCRKTGTTANCRRTGPYGPVRLQSQQL